MARLRPVGRMTTAAAYDDCAIEPIHIPGTIQPHGVLLAVDPVSLEVLQASANVAAVLDRDVSAVVGSAVDALLGAPVADSLRTALAAAPRGNLPALRVALGAAGDVDVSGHHVEDVVVL